MNGNYIVLIKNFFYNRLWKHINATLKKMKGKIMKATDILNLLGGLALFLYGMQMMSNGLEAAAGKKMQKILERLTANRFIGVLVGAGITALIQSSSATTVMVVGFVNSGMMTLQQAVWIIMGANIGTTITGQLVALDIGAMAPLIAFVGVAIAMFVNKKQVQYWAHVIAGLGILFIGMNFMSDSMMPLRDSAAFASIVANFSNPLIGILVGAGFTALIQSSSASVGILQALANSGIVGLPTAVYVLFGQNIGTCITAVLAAIGTSRSAKRTTVIHLMFNIIGTCIFTIVCMTTPLTALVASWSPTNPAGQIANMHTLFNIVTTILLLPFGTQLAALATRILPERASEKEEGFHLKYINVIPEIRSKDIQVGSTAIALHNISNELSRMAGMVTKNILESFDSVEGGTTKYLASVSQREEYIDYLNKEISSYISSIMSQEENAADAAAISAYYKICGNLERIGDHAMNICEYSKRLDEESLSFSDMAIVEIESMKQSCLQAMEYFRTMDPISAGTLKQVSDLEEKIDNLTDSYRENQLARMKVKTCSNKTSILYSEMLTDFERIGDHALNIGEALASM